MIRKGTAMSHQTFARRFAVAFLASASLGFTVYGADTPPTKTSSDRITVRGCLQGLVLTTQDESGTNLPTPHKFVITGDRRTLKTLKMHSGHFEELTGVVKSGKSSGGFVAAEEVSRPPARPRDPVFAENARVPGNWRPGWDRSLRATPRYAG